MKRLDIRTILAPLAVMLMLTILAGYSAYEMTQRWGTAIQQTTLELVRAQALASVQLRLRQAEAARAAHRNPDAIREWREAQRQVAQMEGPLALPRSLSAFMADERNLNRIPTILQTDTFRFSPGRAQEGLLAVQKSAGRVTLIITVSMAMLGVLLMAVTAFDLSRLFAALTRSRDLANRIQEEERRRISRELHDDVIQRLVELRRDYDPHKTDALIDSVRRICQNLKPQALEDLGLADALAQLADALRAHGVSVAMNLDPAEAARVPHGYDLVVFRIVQELFQNIRRHAQATQASLTLIYDPEESPLLRLYVHDNGVGFDPAKTKTGGLGLPGVQDRVQQMGGRFQAKSAPGVGSTFQALIPLYVRRREDHETNDA